MILLSPDTIFDQLYNVDQIFCKDGFYNSLDSSEVFNCKACNCNNQNNNRVARCITCPPMPESNVCNKRTGKCFGCSGKLITTPPFKRDVIEKIDADGFRQHWRIKANKREDRLRTRSIKVEGTCCWEITDKHGGTEEFGLGDEKEPKIWYIKTIKTKKCKIVVCIFKDFTLNILAKVLKK